MFVSVSDEEELECPGVQAKIAGCVVDVARAGAERGKQETGREWEWENENEIENDQEGRE